MSLYTILHTSVAALVNIQSVQAVDAELLRRNSDGNWTVLMDSETNNSQNPSDGEKELYRRVSRQRTTAETNFLALLILFVLWLFLKGLCVSVIQ
jgi:hypothetical protein